MTPASLTGSFKVSFSYLLRSVDRGSSFFRHLRSRNNIFEKTGGWPFLPSYVGTTIKGRFFRKTSIKRSIVSFLINGISTGIRSMPSVFESRFVSPALNEEVWP